ncbi:MAG: hypothetical protein AAFU73_00225 [Planctomycetota bacterium]
MLLKHPGELAEFLVGGFAFAVCGALQMFAAVAGTLTWRLGAKLVGCFAALANLNVRAEAPIRITCYVLVFAACPFFCDRTELACHLRRKNTQKAGAR